MKKNKSILDAQIANYKLHQNPYSWLIYAGCVLKNNTSEKFEQIAIIGVMNSLAFRCDLDFRHLHNV